ncbi:hypothetical protein PAPYR_5789 [Paratrimastix pyriformis]|uniref:Importin N-terminal domain-containing protein n=1 Tax=Paratrimastix pyriformis TaxID=342808 RepID=A0ABQ8ULN6_9EUKA|nr:hypothetical protein PAPYR_5789 [Paratrimastix pyriformis]
MASFTPYTVSAAIQSLYTDPARQKEANLFIMEFSKSSHVFDVVSEHFRSPEFDYRVKLFASQILHSKIKSSWRTLSAETQAQIFSLLEGTLASLPPPLPNPSLSLVKPLRTQLALCVTDALLTRSTADLSSYLEGCCQSIVLTASSPPQEGGEVQTITLGTLLGALQILQVLPAQAQEMSGDEVDSLAGYFRRSALRLMTPLHQILCAAIQGALCIHLEPYTIAGAAAAASPPAPNPAPALVEVLPEVARACLAGILAWVEEFYLSPVSESLARCLSISSLMTQAASALYEVMGKVVPETEYQAIVNQRLTSLFERIAAACPLLLGALPGDASNPVTLRYDAGASGAEALLGALTATVRLTAATVQSHKELVVSSPEGAACWRPCSNPELFGGHVLDTVQQCFYLASDRAVHVAVSLLSQALCCPLPDGGVSAAVISTLPTPPPGTVDWPGTVATLSALGIMCELISKTDKRMDAPLGAIIQLLLTPGGSPPTGGGYSVPVFVDTRQGVPTQATIQMLRFLGSLSNWLAPRPTCATPVVHSLVYPILARAGGEAQDEAKNLVVAAAEVLRVRAHPLLPPSPPSIPTASDHPVMIYAADIDFECGPPRGPSAHAPSRVSEQWVWHCSHPTPHTARAQELCTAASPPSIMYNWFIPCPTAPPLMPLPATAGPGEQVSLGESLIYSMAFLPRLPALARSALSNALAALASQLPLALPRGHLASCGTPPAAPNPLSIAPFALRALDSFGEPSASSIGLRLAGLEAAPAGGGMWVLMQHAMLFHCVRGLVEMKGPTQPGSAEWCTLLSNLATLCKPFEADLVPVPGSRPPPPPDPNAPVDVEGEGLRSVAVSTGGGFRSASSMVGPDVLSQIREAEEEGSRMAGARPGLPQGLTHPLKEAIQHIWPNIDQLVSQFGRDEAIVEAFSRMTRSYLVSVQMHAISHIAEVVKTLTNLYQISSDPAPLDVLSAAITLCGLNHPQAVRLATGNALIDFLPPYAASSVHPQANIISPAERTRLTGVFREVFCAVTTTSLAMLRPDCGARPDICTAYLHLVQSCLLSLPAALTEPDILPLLQLVASVPASTAHPGAVRAAMELLKEYVRRAAAEAPAGGSLGRLTTAEPAEDSKIFLRTWQQYGTHLVGQLVSLLLPPDTDAASSRQLGGLSMGLVPHMADVLMAMCEAFPDVMRSALLAGLQQIPAAVRLGAEVTRFINSLLRERNLVAFRRTVTLFAQELRRASGA